MFFMQTIYFVIFGTLQTGHRRLFKKVLRAQPKCPFINKIKKDMH